jgi:hypothetical protein
MPQKYWWLIGGIVLGAAGAPLIRKIPVVGSLYSKIPTI